MATVQRNLTQIDLDNLSFNEVSNLCDLVKGQDCLLIILSCCSDKVSYLYF